MVHMTNIYLTESDEEALLDFVRDHEELYDKTNEHFKDKARKEFLRETFTYSQKLSLKFARLGSKPKGLTTANSPSPSLARLQNK